LVVKQLKNLLSFLTVFPVKMDNDLLVDCARNMWVFPLIGALLGLIAGLFGLVTFRFLPDLVAGGIVFALLLWMTGLHHTDGLLDFGDGVMAHGTPEHKIDVMHDQLTGAGGLSLGILTMLITTLAIGSMGLPVGRWSIPLVFPAIIVIEMCAKLSMVVAAWAGKSVHQGMNSPFLEAMHGSKGNIRLAVALVISLAISIVFLRIAGIFVVIAAVVSGLAMVLVAHRHFKGVTGDVFGATNELTRLVCAVVVLAVIVR
jgi:adenosylcobinamide-GDP ribazoletransferase